MGLEFLLGAQKLYIYPWNIRNFTLGKGTILKPKADNVE